MCACVSIQYICLCVRVPGEGQGGTLEGSASRREEKRSRLVLMTYIKKTSFTRQGKAHFQPRDHSILSDRVCVWGVFLHTISGHKQRVKHGGWWWVVGVGRGVKKVESKSDSAELSSPQNVCLSLNPSISRPGTESRSLRSSWVSNRQPVTLG